MVYVGDEAAHVQSLDEQSLTCKIPDKSPGAGDFRGNDTEQGLPIVYVSISYIGGKNAASSLLISSRYYNFNWEKYEQ